ncbi:EAL domain-containing protein [Actinoplanes sp. NPDC026619]|uniref:EAL domain-containing protein n=1 Tax=Actinoplanes sp. NPDC026619 TaxID=3155798 RepID=UPI0033C7181B
MWGRGGGRRAARSSSRLFATYLLVSLLPLGALATLLLNGGRVDATKQGQDQGMAQAAVIAEMAVAPALDDADLTRGLTEDERESLAKATDLALYHGSVLRMRLRNFAGQVVYSDDGSTSGGVPVSDPAFQSASVGSAKASLVADDSAAGGVIIRVLQPVFARASGEGVGVLELYLPYDKIATRVHEQMRVTYWRLGVGLGVLYLALGLISWSTTRSLRKYAARQEHEALHDGLTGLPNREAFRQRAAAALAAGRRDESGGAVVVVDLNRFKEVNDTLGHHAGDELLRVITARLRSGLRPQDTVARLGGDEFALILPGLGADGVRDLLEALRAVLTSEMVLDGVPLAIEASFGIALYPQHGDDVEVLLRHADAAMYQGKRGTADIVVYAGQRTAQPTQWLVVQAELRHALERDELVLFYQPKVRLSDGAICGVEALVRWQHPERGLLPPAAFLPAAEQSGLIEPLTAWVLRRALADQAAWMSVGRDWTVSVNVSARNLSAADFAGMVEPLLDEFGTVPGRLILEITETAMVEDADAAMAAIHRLVGRGVGFSLDDFGTGYTSLARLRGVPLVELKIDRTFVATVLDEPENQAIVQLDQALHDSLPQAVRDRGAIRFVTDASYAPMESFAADGRTIIGFEPDLADAIGKVLGVRVEIVTGSFQTALDKVADGTYDGVLSAMTDTVDREKKADFVDYFAAGSSIIVQRGNPRGVVDLASLCGQVVAIEKGTSQADLLHRSQSACKAEPMKINEYKTNADALLQLRTGRAVAVLNDFPAAAFLTTDNRSANYFQLASALQYEPGLFGIPFAKNNSQLRDAVKGALDRVISSGAYADLLERWSLKSGAVTSVSINGAVAG